MYTLLMELLFYKSKYGKFLDKGISWWSGGPYSHVELRFSDGICFSSSFRDGGVRFKEIDIKWYKWDRVKVRVTKRQEDNIRKWCERLVGRKYDLLGILGFIIKRKNWHSKKRYYCSEICLAALNHVGLLPWNRQISPSCLYNLAIKHKVHRL